MRQGAEKHKGEKMPPAGMGAGSQSPWADDGGLIAASDRRAAHVACDSILSSKPCDSILSSKMCVGAMRM